DVARSLNNVAYCLQALGYVAEALSKAEAAASMSDRLSDASSYSYSCHLAVLLGQGGNRQRAVSVLEGAAESLENLRCEARGLTETDRAIYFAELRRHGDACRQLTEARLDLGQWTPALEAWERGRG